MYDFDLNEKFIVYVIYNECRKWYISDKEIWYLDYKKRIEAYRKAGYELKEEYIDASRKDLLCLDRDNIMHFVKRIQRDECSVEKLKNLFLDKKDKDDYKPSLYIDFDKKIFYSMYAEPASYEDYAPIGWNARYQNFLDLIPQKDRYW